MAITLQSPAFTAGGMIPKKYTCDGENVSPPLKWDSVPTGCKTLALICDDPDAPRGTWVHWVLYNLPANVKELPENVPPKETLENGGRQGTNDFKKIGYGGPCPPNGTHHYSFKLYALDAELPLEPGATKDGVLRAMADHTLAGGQLIGTYSR